MNDGWWMVMLIALLGMAAMERDGRGDRLQAELAVCQESKE
jgi:hypothetical protein